MTLLGQRKRKREEAVTHRLGGACHHHLEEIGSLNMPKEEKDPKSFSTFRERLYNLQLKKAGFILSDQEYMDGAFLRLGIFKEIWCFSQDKTCSLHRFSTKILLTLHIMVSSEDDDEHECADDEEWMKNVAPKRPRGPIENDMIALQKEQEGLDEVKRLSEKEICMKVLGKRPACIFSFKPTNREEEFEAENEKLKSELQEMKATMASVKDMQKMINQLQDFEKLIEGVSSSTQMDASMENDVG